MRIKKGRTISFYKIKIKKFITYLRGLNNPEIALLLDIEYKEELLSKRFLSHFLMEWDEYGRSINDSSFIRHMFSRLILRKNQLHFFMKKVGFLILEDESISNIKFIQYLYKQEIALIFGDLLNEFHKLCYEKALEKKSFKDLIKVYNYRYITSPWKRNVAISIYELLKNSNTRNKKQLEEWYFNSLSEAKKLDYLKSLEGDTNISEKRHIELLSFFAKADSSSKVKIYIHNVLYEKGVLHKNVELQKIAFEDNVTNSKNGKKFFELLYNNAREKNDIETIKWMYSIYPLRGRYKNIRCLGRKEVADFLNLPLYATK